MTGTGSDTRSAGTAAYNYVLDVRGSVLMLLDSIASTMGLGGTAHYAPYVASKWAVRGLSRTAALELGRDRIRVNTIHPGVFATAFINESAAGATAAIADFYSPERFAIPRLGEPTDVT